jgi:hypothetical protein
MLAVFHHFYSPESALLRIMIQETFEALRFPLAGTGAPFGHTGLPFPASVLAVHNAKGQPGKTGQPHGTGLDKRG